jgi:beta-barrel assembly-enhancing protease
MSAKSIFPAHPFREVAMQKFVRYLLIVLFVTAFFTCQAITNIVRPLIISDQDEVTLGNKFDSQIRADKVNYPIYTKSSEVITYIDTLGKKIARSQKDRSDLTFSFTVIANDTVVNAFSIPGGHVYVYSGLLKKANNGAEVAGVLAHEIGHITMRHGVNKLVQQYGLEFVNQLIFGKDTASAGHTVANIIEGVTFLDFSRDDEFQADSCGVAYAQAATYNPYGMKSFFQTLNNLYGDNAGLLNILSDHPPTTERITKVQGLINKLSPAPSPTDAATLHVADFSAIKSKL